MNKSTHQASSQLPFHQPSFHQPSSLQLKPLEEAFFAGVVSLGNFVHGNGYLTRQGLQKIYQKGLKNGHNCSFVMCDTSPLEKMTVEQKTGHSKANQVASQTVSQAMGKVVGFRLTYAPKNWSIDPWCSPELWQHPVEQLCYFKSSTVDANYRGQGIAKRMLQASIKATKKQGAKGGVCHTWMQSPGNVAYLYFTRCGGKQIKIHPNRWLEDSHAGYRCVVCLPEKLCHCDAGEMVLYF